MDEFSKAFAKYVRECGRSKAEISRELGMREPQNLNNWISPSSKRGVPHHRRAEVATKYGIPTALIHPDLAPPKGQKQNGDQKWTLVKWAGRKPLTPAQTKLWETVLMWLEDLPDAPAKSIDSLIHFCVHSDDVPTKAKKKVHT